MSLTPKQRVFCGEYLIDMNATRAYKVAYKGVKKDEVAKAAASRLLANVNVRAYLDEKLREIEEKSIANATEVMQYLSKIMRGEDTEQVVVVEGIGDGVSSARTLNKELNQKDRIKAAELLGKRYGMMINITKLDEEEQKARIDKIKAETKLKEKEEMVIEPSYNGIPATMIAPAFIKSLYDIQEHDHDEYVFPGGRGSTKSSFISLVGIDLLEKNPNMHMAVYRQVGDTLRDSVYAQICWAIQALGLENEYKCTVSPMEITKKSTGQKIFFRGCDDPMKSKGIKAPFGYIGILWFEELDQYKGPEAVRTVTQSVIRGGDTCYIFKSFNPPKSSTNWANKYIKTPKENMLVTESTYLEVPQKWLGKVFLEEANFLKETNPTAYENEYMGVANGSGGNVFDNVEIRAITDDEIDQFDRIYFGLDFGWYPDPNAWTKCYYNANRHELYIFDEYRCNKTSNEQMYKILTGKKHMTANDMLICDSAEQKSIGDLRAFGLLARGAIKGPGSVEYSMKWLQSLSKIVIDNARCPESANEFLNYEYDRDKEGNVITGYPDKDNHFIDSIRYALNNVWKKKGQ